MAEKRGACPLKAGTLTKGFTPLLEREGKEAKKGDWNDGTREAELPRGGRGRSCPSPSCVLPHPPPFLSILWEHLHSEIKAGSLICILKG